MVPNDSVAATAGHEFVHAMGLGHAFNKPGDLMCSEEDGVPTCGRSNSNSDIPSSLNLAGIAELYGVDGFLNPNNDVNYGTQFAEGSNQNSNSGSASSGCPQGGYTYDRSIEDRTLEPRHYVWYRICSSQISYTFSTASQYTGFLLYLVTPETDVRGFINDGEGRYYTCEEYGTHWHSKSNTCNISPGAKIVLHNDGDDTLHISGRIWN